MAKPLDYDITRVNYNLPTKLVERVKEYSKENGVPITYGVVQLLNKGLENDTILKYLPQITELAKELEKSNKKIDSDKVKEIASRFDFNDD